MKALKTIKFLSLLFLSIQTLFSQENFLKEVQSYYDNGNPKKVWKTKEINDVTNGSSVLACMNPQKDPGFTTKGGYGKPNNKRASRIISCKNKQSS